MKEPFADESIPPEIGEEDVFEAMKLIPGYLDITPGDFRIIYRAAYAIAIKRIFSNVIASSIMTSPVFTVLQDMALVEAAGFLAEKRISGAPVIDRQGLVVGVVSEKDFLRAMGFLQTPSFMQIATHCLNDKSCMIGKLHHKTVGDIMARPPITGTPEMRVGEISSLFAERKINRLPIVDDKKHPVGIVTRTDLAHSLYKIGNGAKS